MNIIKESKENTLEVKNSKFITKIFYIDNENDAIETIKSIKKKYFDARHNCYAYKIGYDNPIIKQSDDGEPKGTAGIPIFNAIIQNELTNCLIIVTRYFGGVLLGASLLLRTYQDSASEVVKLADKSELLKGFIYDISFEYTYYNTILKYIQNNNQKIIISKNDFDNNVHLSLFVSKDIVDELIDRLNDITKAKVIVNKNKNILFANFGNEVKIIKEYE